ncbi:DUF6699 domain-containing protein [Pleurotus pulmonarius]
MPNASVGDQREPWMQFGGFYRPINDLSQPWVASPAVTTQTLPLAKFALAIHERPVAVDDGDRGKKHRRKAWRFLDRLRGSGSPSSTKRNVSVPATEPFMSDQVPLPEWKAYGYYACPRVNGVVVRNSSPTAETPDVDIQEMFDSLRDVDGDHPERWISGTQHPALPPRPTRWKEPNPQDPLPFPWECQLNPFLEHRLFGPMSLWFDVREDPSMLCYGTVDTMIPLSPADRMQPATYPFLTHMFINAIGDDPIQPFLWPFMVRNPKGIKCEDVYNAVYENFQEYVSQSEYDDWPQVRQVQCTQSYGARHSSRANRESGFVEGIRRVDYLGDNIMFRGLEPNPNIDGWVMCVGRTW